MSAPYTDEEIEQHLDELDMLGPNAAYLDTGSAAIIRQLLAERRASKKEKSENADCIIRLFASTKCDDHSENARHMDFASFRTHEMALGCNDCQAAELADLRAYRQRRESEDKADHIGDANKMVPAAGNVLTEAQAVALATRAAEIAAEAAIDVVMDCNVFAINTIAEYIKRGEYDNRTKSKTAMEREFVIAAAAVGRAWEERT